MWTWSLNWGQITDHIVIGTCPMTPDDLRRIHSEAGVSGVLSLQNDDCLACYGCCEDLVARYREVIERRVYELYELGVHDDADADWFQSQAEILRSMLTQANSEKDLFCF